MSAKHKSSVAVAQSLKEHQGEAHSKWKAAFGNALSTASPT